ncbi:DUF6328 family protein [Streptomyces orinoci]|uniref:DUF6328 family protein n=1 Tax=Streptomyces orinoci TaxID=67339 RepID=A0ABV3K3E0_STRON|nr:DUF6328 family protein [Streptomyces orinoci]
MASSGTGPETGGTGRQRHGRDESPEERADRRWNDLIQEVRVAQTGVQILFGFLMTVAFTPVFARLGHTEKTIYVVTVVLGAATTGALVGPVSFHRLVTGHRLKPQTVLWASRLTLMGVVLLLATMVSVLLLVLRVALRGPAVPWVVAGVAAWFLGCWFGLPLWTRHHYGRRK